MLLPRAFTHDYHSTLLAVTSRVSNKSANRQMAHSPMLYLDNDLQHKLSLQPGVAQLIVEQIFRDSDFLTRK